MGDEADADWQDGLAEWGAQEAKQAMGRSWYCDQCSVEVYERRCSHCGKTKRERR